MDKLDKCFTFKLSPTAKIWVIDNIEDLRRYLTPLSKYGYDGFLGREKVIDIDQLFAEGYDGIYVTAKAAIDLRYNVESNLASWDCESLCVFNKDVIRQINDGKDMGKEIIRINESQFKTIIKESVKKVLREFEWDDESELPEYLRDMQGEEDRFDDYGEPIKKGGQGYGIDAMQRNRQGYEEDGRKGPWFSRSVAMATAVILNDRGKYYVLGNQRGTGAPDYQGWWNLPCGYLDYNEDAMDGARREVYEETGIKLKRSQMEQISVSSDPRQNRQNICFFFMAKIEGSPEDFPFSKENMEENEVGGIRWIPLEEVNNVKWAFWHNRMLKELIGKLGI